MATAESSTPGAGAGLGPGHPPGASVSKDAKGPATAEPFDASTMTALTELEASER